MHVKPYTAELNVLNFNSLEVVRRCRDPQLQVGENHPYLLILNQTFANLNV